MGQHNSVGQKFIANNENIKVIKCPCHSIHLCAESSIKKLPGDIPKMLQMTQ